MDATDVDAFEAAAATASFGVFPSAREATDHFRRISSNPHCWIAQSQNSAEAADVLWKPIGEGWQRIRASIENRSHADDVVATMARMPAFLMLAGFAIEALLKALLIERQVAPLRERQMPEWPREAKRHNLRGMATLLGLHTQISGREAELVLHMSDAILWLGRYPSPTRFEEMFSGGTRTSTLGFGYQWTDLDVWRGLFDRWTEIALEALHSKPSDSGSV